MFINPLVVPPTQVNTEAILGTNIAVINEENIIKHVNIKCF